MTRDIVGPTREREIRRLELQLEIAREALVDIREHWSSKRTLWTFERAQRALNRLDDKS
jgi:hypothetical protein